MALSFTAQVDKWAKKTGATVNDSVKAIRVQVVGGIVSRNPVDTGRSRGAWVATIGSPSPEMPTILDKSGATSITLAAKVAQKDISNVFYLTNNLPYIRKLEYAAVGQGGSSQAPNGMVRITLQELKDGLERLIKDV